MRVTAFNNFPGRRDDFWQCVLIPTVSILKSVDLCDKYTCVTVEFLFWSVSFLIDKP